MFVQYNFIYLMIIISVIFISNHIMRRQLKLVLSCTSWTWTMLMLREMVCINIKWTFMNIHLVCSVFLRGVKYLNLSMLLCSSTWHNNCTENLIYSCDITTCERKVSPPASIWHIWISLLYVSFEWDYS